jgi:hypothetical protein
MPERINDRMIHRKIERMQKQGMDVALDGAYGRWRIVNRQENYNLSPRVSNREIYEWLDAYEKGFDAGKARGESDMRHGRLEEGEPGNMGDM